MENPPLAGETFAKLLRMKRNIKEIPFGEIRRVLIRSANWVGDAVMSLPAIASIRLSFPGAKISILAKPWVGDLPFFCRTPLRLHGSLSWQEFQKEPDTAPMDEASCSRTRSPLMPPSKEGIKSTII
jgi:hypothetical protein